jgi:type IV pilus assembly protein PilZ
MPDHARSRGEAEFSETTRLPEDVDAQSTEMATRRVHSRFSVVLDVTVSSEHNFYAGFVENMSVGGVFIATHQLKPVGDRVELHVNLPGLDQPIRGKGEVRWIRVFSEESNVPPGMGIKFDALDAADVRSIEQFLAQREPLFYEED